MSSGTLEDSAGMDGEPGADDIARVVVAIDTYDRRVQAAASSGVKQSSRRLPME